jgi:hypothetical protein
MTGYRKYSGIDMSNSPHFYRPQFPVNLQQYVNATPMDGGDGVPVVDAPPAINYYKAGPPRYAYHLPAKARRMGMVHGGYGAGHDEFLSKFAQALTNIGISPEVQEQAKQGVTGNVAMRLCNAGITAFCPTEQSFEQGYYRPPYGLIAGVVVGAVALTGLVVYAIAK